MKIYFYLRQLVSKPENKSPKPSRKISAFAAKKVNLYLLRLQAMLAMPYEFGHQHDPKQSRTEVINEIDRKSFYAKLICPLIAPISTYTDRINHDDKTNSSAGFSNN